MKECTGSWDAVFAGALAGGVSRAIVTPLDVVKIRLQLQLEAVKEGPSSTQDARSYARVTEAAAAAAQRSTAAAGAGGQQQRAPPLELHQHAAESIKQPGKYRGFTHCVQTMLREEGLRSFWRGHVAEQALAMSYCAVQFPCYEYLLSSLKERVAMDRWLMEFLAGGVAGCAATVTTYPFDILRTRLASQGPHRVYHGLVHGATHIVRTEGWPALYKGLVPTVVTIFPYAGLQFAFYSAFQGVIKAVLHKDGGEAHHKQLEKLLAGASSGVVTKVFLHPLDVVKKRLQTQGFEEARKHFGKTAKFTGVVSSLRQIARHEGMHGLFKGLTPTVIKAAPNTAITFVAYDYLFAWIKGSHNR